MGQVRFYGADREAFMEYVSVGDIKALPFGKGRLSCMLNTQAGILDDIIVTRFEHCYTRKLREKNALSVSLCALLYGLRNGGRRTVALLCGCSGIRPNLHSVG
jgi:hypothetical protein